MQVTPKFGLIHWECSYYGENLILFKLSHHLISNLTTTLIQTQTLTKKASNTQHSINLHHHKSTHTPHPHSNIPMFENLYNLTLSKSSHTHFSFSHSKISLYLFTNQINLFDLRLSLFYRAHVMCSYRLPRISSLFARLLIEPKVDYQNGFF